MKRTENKLEQASLRSAWERDWKLLEEYHPNILDAIKDDVAAGIPVSRIVRWYRSAITEPKLLQQIENAARYEEVTNVN